MRTLICPIPDDLRASLQQKAKDLDVLFKAGKIPQYADFVEGLFKPIKTVEFDEATGVIGTEIIICPKQTMLHAMVGVSGEAGESLDASKKNWAYNKPLDHENVIEELADSFFYIVAALNLMGLELNDLVAHNMTKLLKRYPDGYSDQAAQARADKVEATPEPDRTRDHIGAEK